MPHEGSLSPWGRCQLWLLLLRRGGPPNYEVALARDSDTKRDVYVYVYIYICMHVYTMYTCMYYIHTCVELDEKR